jgi:hypothetical protein
LNDLVCFVIGKTVQQLYAIMGVNWRSMSVDEKMHYFNLNETNRKEKKKELNKIFSQLSDEDGDKIEKQISANISKRRKKLAKLRLKKVLK